MDESPLFAKIKAEGKISKNPIKESFTNKENLGMVLLALFGATAGQGVVWYTGQFYALTFIQKTCSIEFVQSYAIIAIALFLGTPLFIVFGSWSDSFGRKWIMLSGMLLAVIFYRPIYNQMFSIAQTDKETELVNLQMRQAVVSITEMGDTLNTVTINRVYENGLKVKETTKTLGEAKPETIKEVTLGNNSFWMMMALIFAQLVFVAMAYGPIAAFLVELFPTRIRYTSMSLPYHIGNGVFGGLTPFIATALFEYSKSDSNPAGDPLAGLWYPIVVAAITFVIGAIFLSNKVKGEVME